MGTDLGPVDVLQVITTTGRRGAEVFAYALHPELERRGLTVRTVALVAGAEPTLPVEPLGPSRLGLRTLMGLRRQAHQATVVVAHGSTALPATALATAGTGVPFVYRNIGDPAYWSTTRRRRLRSRLVLTRASAVVALTAETGERLQRYYGVPAHKVTPIPRAVSPVDFPLAGPADRIRARQALGLGADDRIAVCIGALSPEKSVPDAVQAIALLPDRWRLLVAGEGPDRPAVEQAAAGLGHRVLLLGPVSDPAQLMAAADVLVLPSRTEGLPGVVVEAAMTGVATVATDVGFVREIIQDGTTGAIVPPGDPAAMARAVLGAENRLGQMGAAAHDRVHQLFSLESAADRWYEVLAAFLPQTRVRETGKEARQEAGKEAGKEG